MGLHVDQKDGVERKDREGLGDGEGKRSWGRVE